MYGKRFRWLCCFSWSFNVFLAFWGVLIIHKLLILTPGHINFETCDQIGTLGPCIYNQHTSTNTRKYGNLLEHFHIWESDILNLLEGMRTYFVWVCSVAYCLWGDFEILKYWNVRVLKFRKWNSGIWQSKNETLESLNYQMLWRLALGNDDDPRKQILNTLDMNFISIQKHEMEIW